MSEKLSQNRAVDGDHVAIQLLEKKDWSAPAELILDDDGGKADPGDTLDDGDKSLLDRAVKKREDVQGRDHKLKLGSGRFRIDFSQRPIAARSATLNTFLRFFTK